MDSYPASFTEFRRHESINEHLFSLSSIEGVSASNWTEKHLYMFRVTVGVVELSENSQELSSDARDLFRQARSHLQENQQLNNALGALKGKQHHLPNTMIMAILKEKNVGEAFSFFACLRGLLEPKDHYTPILHENDESKVVEAVESRIHPPKKPATLAVNVPKRKESTSRKPSKWSRLELDIVNETDSLYHYKLSADGPYTRSRARTHQSEKRHLAPIETPLSPSYGEERFKDDESLNSNISNDDKAGKERLKDELVTTNMPVDVFVSLIFALLVYYEFKGQRARKPGDDNPAHYYRSFTVAQKYYKVKTRFGRFNTKTDGGVYELYFEVQKCRRADPTTNANIADFEAKAAADFEPLPQHAAELIGHMPFRLRTLYHSDDPLLLSPNQLQSSWGYFHTGVP